MLDVIRELIEAETIAMRTAFFGRIVSVSGNKCTIQPLTMMKQTSGRTLKQAAIKNVPILRNARYKIGTATFTHESEEIHYLTGTPISSGDIALCVCTDRDITDQANGKSSVPTRHHDITDAVVIGVI